MVNWLLRQRPGIPGWLRWDARCSLSTFGRDASPLEARQKRELTLLVDGNNMLYEAYDPRSTVAWNNQQVGTAMRFVQRLHEILRAKNATRIAVFFDTPHVTKRQLGNAQYKPKHRKRMMPHPLRAQFPVTKSVLEQLGIPVIQVPGVEADDLIASYTKESIDEGFDVIIVTNDTDMYQLVKTIGTGDDGTDQSVVVYQPFRGRTIPERRVIKLLHGARPDQQPEIRALCGDPRGKTPGIPGGVSIQDAIQLLKQHGNLPSLLRNLDELDDRGLAQRLKASISLIEQSYRSSVLNNAVPLPIPTEQLSISQPFQFDHSVLLQFFGRDGAEEVVALKEKTKEAKPHFTKITFMLSSYRLRHALRVSIYHTSDIVNHPPLCGVLINPCNEELTGTRRFSYFPRGGPVPPPVPPGLESESAKWGGMDAGENLLYPAQTVDGLVTLAGGTALREHLANLPGSPKCPCGSAVVTPSTGSLVNHFQAIVHTSTPFYSSPEWAIKLHQCYSNSLTKAILINSTIATPLLGAGCKGAPIAEASKIAAEACRSWDESNRSTPAHLMFGIQDLAVHPRLHGEFHSI